MLLPVLRIVAARVQFVQRPVQAAQIGLLPRGLRRKNATAVKVDQADLSGLIDKDVVCIQIGMKYTQRMETPHADTNPCGHIKLITHHIQHGGQGLRTHEALGHQVRSVKSAITRPAATDGARYRQACRMQSTQQAVLHQAAGTRTPGPQKAIIQHASNAAAAPVMAQNTLAHGRVNNKHTASATIQCTQSVLFLPVCGFEPAPIEIGHPSRIEHDASAAVGYDAFFRHRLNCLAMHHSDSSHHGPSLTSLNATALESVCLLRTSALGDVTHVVPLLRRLQQGLPGARLTWIVGKLERKLVGDVPGVEFITFDKSRGVAGWRAVGDALAGRRFDALLHMQVALRANLLSLAVSARRRIGYDSARSKDLHRAFINERIPPGHRQHVLDAIGSFGDMLGVNPGTIRWDIPIPDEDRHWAEQQWPDGEPVLLINACASHPLRNWHAAGYAAVADHAARSMHMRVVLTGGPSDAERRMGDAILAQMHNQPLDLIGKDTLKRAMALYSRGSILLTPDSGPMHMANAVGTPVLGLHAASNPDRSGPYTDRQWCVNRYDDAARKYLGKPALELPWGRKIERPGVMDLITVEDVIERLDAFAQRQ